MGWLRSSPPKTKPRPKPDASSFHFAFEPREDITAYELAQVLANVTFQGASLKRIIVHPNGEFPEPLRHFRFVGLVPASGSAP